MLRPKWVFLSRGFDRLCAFTHGNPSPASGRERITKTVREAASAGQEYEIQWRLNVPEGAPERSLLVRGCPVAGASGAPERCIGIVIDITDRKWAEEALRKAEERERQEREELETILDALPAAVLIAKDPGCLEIAGNRAACELLQLPPGSNLSKSAPADQSPNNFDVFQNERRLAPSNCRCERLPRNVRFHGRT